MSAYDEGRFVESFAQRTKENLKFIENIVNEEKSKGKCNNEISLYETTQLINSLIGLLVFPKERYFELINDDITFDGNSESKLIYDKYVRNEGEYTYENTYLKRKRINGTLTPVYQTEDFTIKFLINKLRNSVSHNKINILPVRPKTGEDIKYIIFKDEGKTLYFSEDHKEFLGYYYRNNKLINYEVVIERFGITISVSDLRILLYSICDLLLEAAKKSRGL